MFSAYSPLAGGNISDLLHASESPFDLDAGLKYTRPHGANGPWPHPDVIGHVSGILPLFDALVYASASHKVAFGPWTGTQVTDLNSVFPDFRGGLPKVAG